MPRNRKRKRHRTPHRRSNEQQDEKVATDTPEKDQIEKRAEEHKRKKTKIQARTVVKRKVLNNSSSEDDEQISIYSEEEPVFEEEAEILINNPDKFVPLISLPKEGDFVLVLFEVKTKNIYYIAKVIGEKDGDTEVTFLRKSVSKNPNKFHLPVVPDLATVALHDIKLILPQPGFTGSTKRTQGLHYFDVDFTNIDLR